MIEAIQELRQYSAVGVRPSIAVGSRVREQCSVLGTRGLKSFTKVFGKNCLCDTTCSLVTGNKNTPGARCFVCVDGIIISVVIIAVNAGIIRSRR